MVSMSDEEKPWSRDAEILVKPFQEEERERLTALIDSAGQLARSGNLTAAAEALETVRRALVAIDVFGRFDNDIWVFTDIIHAIRRESKESPVPPAYQRFLDAIPSARMDQDMTLTQKGFWYGSPSANVGGEIRVLTPEEAAKGKKDGCFIVTAVCSPESLEVNLFRSFRDRVRCATLSASDSSRGITDGHRRRQAGSPLTLSLGGSFD
jgi:hypothetical protein